MATNLEVEIISPTGILFEGKCYMAVVPSVNGEIGVMRDHESFIAKLKAGEVKIFKDGQNQTNSFPLEGGFAEIESHGRLIILID